MARSSQKSNPSPVKNQVSSSSSFWDHTIYVVPYFIRHLTDSLEKGTEHDEDDT